MSDDGSPPSGSRPALSKRFASELKHIARDLRRWQRTVRLIFPYVSNQAGMDTGISIVNLSMSVLLTRTSGYLTINYYGHGGTGSDLPPAAQTVTSSVAAGEHVTFTLGDGGTTVFAQPRVFGDTWKWFARFRPTESPHSTP